MNKSNFNYEKYNSRVNKVGIIIGVIISILLYGLIPDGGSSSNDKLYGLFIGAITWFVILLLFTKKTV